MKKKLHSSQDRLPEEGGEGEDVGRETEAEEEEAGVITAEIEAIVYGSSSGDPDNDDRFGPDQRRVHVTLRPILPANLTTTDQRIKWINGFFWKISRDMRHTADWRCEFCSAFGAKIEITLHLLTRISIYSERGAGDCQDKRNLDALGPSSRKFLCTSLSSFSLVPVAKFSWLDPQCL
jgi:hypothetical protein